MKWIVITLILMTYRPLWAAEENELLKCLGAEEKKMHLKKEIGPIYDLNQRLIAEMIQIPRAHINPQDLREVCGKSTPHPALKLLELSIKKGKGLFTLRAGATGMQQEITKGMIDDYAEGTKEMFINFVNQVQILAPSADCLKEEIPELDKLFTEIKYLQEDVDLKDIIEKKDIKIFEKLKNYPSAYKRCRARLKKKPKSGSTEAPKKS